jgi:Uncharacterized conserved protein (COG2071)
MHVVTRAPLKLRSQRSAARLLEAALVFNFVIHAVAMVSMAMLLLPGMPGGGADDMTRVKYVAEHSFAWRLGWFPWQVTAVADVLLCVALLRTSWIPRRPAWITLFVTCAAVIPDQVGQFLWTTRGVSLAAISARTGDLAPYGTFEAYVFFAVGIVACLGYLLGALGWTWCFMAAGTWSRRLTWMSAATWGMFFAALGFYVLSAPGWVSFANAVGFILLLAWFVAVTERVAARCRPDDANGRYAPWRHPHAGLLGRAIDGLANSRFARVLAEWIPTPALASDIRDVVYVNYLVDADRLEPLLPEGLDLQRIGPDGHYALFTFLTYRHGHFGPAVLGPLRRHLPSPIQSNWRIYVVDPKTNKRGVYFVTTAISSTPHALAGRLLSEGVPMHVWRRADLARDASGTIHLSIEPGGGTAPDARATLRPSLDRTIPQEWKRCFDDWKGFLGYCVPQDRAMTFQPWYDRVTRQEIELGISLDECRKLEGRVESAAARAIVGDAEPVCFHVPLVKFRFEREEYDSRTAAAGAKAAAATPAPRALAA